ncbi:MAG: hypothetical protein QM606_05835 [Leucobacter sp.]
MTTTPIAQAGPYWIGDTPHRPVPVEFVDEYDEVADPPLEPLTAVLRDPFRRVRPDLLNVARTVDPGGAPDEVEIEWDADGAPFDIPGPWSILMRAGGDRLAPIRFVVEEESGWVSLDAAREEWKDAPASDPALWSILESAKLSCLRHGPRLSDPTQPPANFTQAQLMQARSIWNAHQAGPGDTIGPDGFVVRVYPIDQNIFRMLGARVRIR